MSRERMEKTFCWKLSGELKLFKFRILKMKKKEIFQAAYQIDAVICIVDLMKRDSEIKILIGCTEEEKDIIDQTHNETQYMKGMMIRR